MKIRLASLTLAALGASAAPGAWAVEYGTVVSSTPVVVSTQVTQRDCSAEPGAAPSSRGGSGGSGVGALAGAVVGAALGNALGGGSGRAVATGIGMIAGAALGNHAEAEEAERIAAPTQRCRDVTRYEQRTVGYDVVYDYQGVRRSVRLAQLPGDRIPLEVQVVPAGQPYGPISQAQQLPQAPQAAQYPQYSQYPQYPQAAPVPPPAPRVYRTPADNPPDYYYDEPPAPRVVYAPPPPPAPVYAAQPAAVNPWPYIIVGGVGAWAISNAYKHRHVQPRWRHR
jgi:uncharacterized protein YcfJ